MQAEARRSKKPPAPSVDGATGAEAAAPLPYADVATKDHEIGLVCAGPSCAPTVSSPLRGCVLRVGRTTMGEHTAAANFTAR